METVGRLAPPAAAAEQPLPAETTRSARAARAVAGGRRDPDAFEAAVRPHYAPLVRRLVVVLGDEHDAEDVAQEAYLRAFRSWDRFDGADVRAWLYTIALRLAFNQLRRRRRWLGILGGGRLGRAEPAPWTDRSDPDLWAALGGLDRRTRAAILLNVLDGYTHREIASMFGVPEGTVASWISRGRSTLRAELGGGGGAPATRPRAEPPAGLGGLAPSPRRPAAPPLHRPGRAAVPPPGPLSAPPGPRGAPEPAVRPYSPPPTPR